MNITREDQGDLTATLKVEVSKEDYEEKVNEQLKDYKKKANMPGFRPGKVPFGMIKKMYGRAVVAEEVNKIVSEELLKYIQENDIKILGHPMPNNEKTPAIDWSVQEEFEFYFDVGLYPEIEVDLENIEVDYYKVKASDEDVDKTIENMRHRFGENTHPEESDKGDSLKGQFEELDENGDVKEDGIKNESTILVDYIKDEDTQKKFIGLKVGDQVDFDPHKSSGDNLTEMGSLLGIEKEQAEKIESNFRFTLDEINRLIPAEVNEEFFKKVYPNEEIENEEQFRARVEKDVENQYGSVGDQRFMSDATQKLIDKADIELPEEFMKNWLAQNDENLTKEQVEESWEQYKRDMKWQLIENKLMNDHDIQVTDDEVKNFVKEQFRPYLAQSGEPEEEIDKRLQAAAESMMQDEKQVEQFTSQLRYEKLMKLLKDKLKINTKEVTYAELMQQDSNQNNDDK
ncbi:MAG: trigger factor [Bacteroidales bacterium]|nr:trigger factor [Bacteroidales bacterium]